MYFVLVILLLVGKLFCSMLLLCLLLKQNIW
uniref:Uncharacterized protein n=1 Tax=Rhizophora mucronata TaxID=61149 RepID=A0A2P2QEH4_RHIMU